MMLQGKVVLVTGAARRVGRVIAASVAQRGARVVVHYNRSRDEAERFAGELKSSFGRDSMTARADLNDTRQIERMVAAVGKRFGAIDVLVNNASIYEKSDFGRTSVQEWDAELNTNLRAPFFLAQAVAPYMRRAGAGKIINIADWAGLRPYADYIPYCVSKAGLLCLNTALAKALAPQIQVNAVMPGPVLLPERFTPRMAENVRNATLLKRLGTPQDVAKAVLYLIENADFVTGAAIPVDGGRLVA